MLNKHKQQKKKRCEEDMEEEEQVEDDEEEEELVPWYRGFKGRIQKKTSKSFVATGIMTGSIEEGGTFTISELPPECATSDYKSKVLAPMLEEGGEGGGKGEKKRKSGKPKSKDGKKKKNASSDDDDDVDDGASTISSVRISEFREEHSDTSVRFSFSIDPNLLKELSISTLQQLEKAFKLTRSYSTTNMHLLCIGGGVRKFESTQAILECYFEARIAKYEERLELMERLLRADLDKLDNQVRFIRLICQGDLKVNKKKARLIADLRSLSFTSIASSKNRNNKSEVKGKLSSQGEGGGGGGGRCKTGTGEEEEEDEEKEEEEDADADMEVEGDEDGGSSSRDVKGGKGFDYLLRMEVNYCT